MYKVIVKNQAEADPNGIADFEYFFGNRETCFAGCQKAEQLAELLNKEADDIDWEWERPIYDVQIDWDSY